MSPEQPSWRRDHCHGPSATQLVAVYSKPPGSAAANPQASNDDYEILAGAWQAANTKARELGVDRVRGVNRSLAKESPGEVIGAEALHCEGDDPQA